LHPNKYGLSGPHSSAAAATLRVFRGRGVVFGLDNLVGKLVNLRHQQQLGCIRRDVHARLSQRLVMCEPKEEGYESRSVDIVSEACSA
jgi:hypothetical protein